MAGQRFLSLCLYLLISVLPLAGVAAERSSEVLTDRETILALDQVLQQSGRNLGAPVTPYFWANGRPVIVMRERGGARKTCYRMSFRLDPVRVAGRDRFPCRRGLPSVVPPGAADRGLKAVSLTELARRYPDGTDLESVSAHGRRMGFGHSASIVELDATIRGEPREVVLDFNRTAQMYPVREFSVEYELSARFEPKSPNSILRQRSRLTAGALSILPERSWEKMNSIPFYSRDRIWEDFEGNLVFYFHPNPHPFSADWYRVDPERLTKLISGPESQSARCYRDEFGYGQLPWEALGCHHQVERSSPVKMEAVVILEVNLNQSR